MKKKILIAGDSFAANWRIKYNGAGWVNLLENDYDVTNIAQAGVSEYKILKQLEKQDLNGYDHIIVSHTSAYRIPIQEHPIHKDDILHKNCDIIYTDVEEHMDNDPIMKIAYGFYAHIFDANYFTYVNDLIYKDIKKKSAKIINITFFNSFYDDDVLKFEDIFLNNKGEMNHMNRKGNKIIFDEIKKILS